MIDAHDQTQAGRTPVAEAGAHLAFGIVALLVVIAAAAPLFASDLPYAAWGGDGDSRWQLPLFRALSAADWLWLVGPALALLWRGGRHRRRVRAVLTGVVVTVPVVVALIRWWGGDAWLDRLAGQGQCWWFLTAGLLTVSALSLAVAVWCAKHRPGASRIFTALGVVVLVLMSSRVATVDRPALDHWKPTAGMRMISPPIHYDWNAAHLDQRLLLPGRDADGHRIHFLGTDSAGADVLARLFHATRIAVTVGALSAGVAVTLGALFGLLMGFFGGWIDLLGMRVVELFMAVPRLVLILAVVVFLPGRDSVASLVALVLVIGLTGWMRPARLMRAEVQRLRIADYVLAAQAAGVSWWSLLTRHLLVNCIGPVLVEGGFAVSAAVLMETNLSFLGLGVPPSQPSWGALLSQAIDPATGVFHWWLAVGPGAAILATVLACNTLAEHARRRLGGRVPRGERRV